MARILAILLALAFSCSAEAAPRYRDARVKTIATASLRLVVFCAPGSKMPGFRIGGGSAVAVTSRHLLTARHVIEAAPQRAAMHCGGKDLYVILARSLDGPTVEVLPDGLHPDAEVDAGRLVAVGMARPFKPARLANRGASIGDGVCLFTGDYQIPFLYKCGHVGFVNENVIYSDVLTFPGNSGSGIFNERGEIVGTTQGGNWIDHRPKPPKEKGGEPRYEEIGELWHAGPSVDQLRVLVPADL